jgi:hypothetical protein
LKFAIELVQAEMLVLTGYFSSRCGVLEFIVVLFVLRLQQKAEMLCTIRLRLQRQLPVTGLVCVAALN